jgi:CHAD domain-containing protein
MAFLQGQDLADRTQQLAREECRAIGRALAARHRRHEAIHEARKRIRRLRALLALVEERIPAASAIDLSLARLGDGLSSARDAHVVLETAKRVAGDERERWAPAIQALKARRDARLERLLALDPGFLRRRALVRRLEAQLDFLAWPLLRLADFKTGIEASQRRVLAAEERAARDPGADPIHRWRRRVRRVRFQLEALGQVSPTTLQQFSRRHPERDPKLLHRLGDALGDRRDEQMLEAALRRVPGLRERPALISRLHAARAPTPSPMAPKRYPEPLLLRPDAERALPA